VYHRLPDDGELVVKLFAAPAFFGEMEVLLGVPWRESVVALVASNVCEIPAKALCWLVAHDVGFAAALARDVARRLLIATEHARELATGTVRMRLAGLLTDYAALFGEPDGNGWVRISVPLTQSSLGRELAVSRKIVNRSISDFEKEKLLRRS